MSTVSSGMYVNKPLWGWYSYAFASEVFAVCSLTLFLPVCLEQFARDNGVLLPEKMLPCPKLGTSGDGRCVVRLGWAWIDTASYSLYVFSASVAAQALTVISLGGLADNHRLRKFILLLFAVIGSTASILFLAIPSSSPIWPISALLAITANVSFGVSVVCLNSYLPQLARNDDNVKEAYAQLRAAHNGLNGSLDAEDEECNDANPEERTLLAVRPPEDAVLDADGAGSASETYAELVSRATSQISSNGIAIGYGAGIALLILLLVPVTLLKGSTFALRLSISLTGLWWMLFTMPAALWLPGFSSLGANREAYVTGSISGEISRAWIRLGRMLRPSEVAKLRNTFWFLLAWFLLSDGFTTITSTAILFAKTSLHMGATSLMLIGAITPAAGIFGAILWPIAQKKIDMSNLHSLVVLVCLASVIPAYGCLGFLPIFRGDPSIASATALRFGGLTTPAEMYVLAVYFGSLYGAFQSYARAAYSELIPEAEAARWYGLYSITDKSSSFFGPLIVGLIADATGNIRYGFFFLVIMILLPVPVLLRKVSVAEGRRDAQQYTRGD